MHETSGVLRPAVWAYLQGETLTGEHIAAIRAYLRQWINADGWPPGPELDALRAGIDGLISQEAIDGWLEAAERIGIDPL